MERNSGNIQSSEGKNVEFYVGADGELIPVPSPEPVEEFAGNPNHSPTDGKFTSGSDSGSASTKPTKQAQSAFRKQMENSFEGLSKIYEYYQGDDDPDTNLNTIAANADSLRQKLSDTKNDSERKGLLKEIKGFISDNKP